MKKAIGIFIILITALSSGAQVDSTQVVKKKAGIDDSIIVFRPYVEMGTDFLLNEQAQKNYQTNSIFYWGVGLRIGNPDPKKMNLFFGYTNSGTQIEQGYGNSKADSTLRVRQYHIGLVIPVALSKNIFLRSRVAYVYSSVKDSYYYYDEYNTSYGSNYVPGYTPTKVSGHGTMLAIGIDKRVFKDAKFYMELSYNFMKLPGTTYKLYNNYAKSYETFNTARLTLGFTL